MAEEKGPPSHESTLGAQHGAPEGIAKHYAKHGSTDAPSESKVEKIEPAAAIPDLDSLTVAELHEIAKDRGIHGHVSMHKDELIRAIKRHK